MVEHWPAEPEDLVQVPVRLGVAVYLYMSFLCNNIDGAAGYYIRKQNHTRIKSLRCLLLLSSKRAKDIFLSIYSMFKK